MSNLSKTIIDAIKKQSYKTQKMKGGKQGIVGLFEVEGKKFLYKVSSDLTLIGTHEHAILKSLEKVTSLCPFFIKSYTVVNLMYGEDYEDSEDPFKIKSKAKYYLDTCFVEYVEDSRKFLSFIKHAPVPDKIISSIMSQTFMGIMLAQYHARFSHYDLHSQNILVQKCNDNLVMLYYSKVNDKTYMTPTYGYVPRIIDYGFSYSDEGTKRICSPLDFMDSGYTSIIYDDLVDARVFMISTLDDIMTYRGKENDFYRYLDVYCDKLFGDIDMDEESGWFINKRKCAVDYLERQLLDYSAESDSFDESMSHMLTYLQYIMDIPLSSKRVNDDIEELTSDAIFAFKSMLTQFIKLEKDFKDGYQGMYLFRVLCLAAREAKHDRKNGYAIFKREVFDQLSKTKSYYTPKANWEKLLTSILLLTECLEAIMAKELDYRIKFINKQYKRMPIKTMPDIMYVYFKNVNKECLCDFVIKGDTHFVLIDEENGTSNVFQLKKKEIEFINDLNDFAKGDAIRKCYLSGIIAEKRSIKYSHRSIGMGSMSSSDSECNSSSDSENDFDWRCNAESDSEPDEDEVDLDEF